MSLTTQRPFRDRRRSRGLGEGRLLERAEILAEIESILDGSWPHTVGPIVIEGGYGLGKTALLNASAHMATALGLTVARSRLVEDADAVPYGVVRDILSQVPACKDLLHLFDDPEADLTAVSAAIDECFAIAPPGRMLIAIDDAHWADAESASWLQMLCRRMHIHHAHVIITMRPRRRTDPLVSFDAVLFDHNTRLLRLAPLSASGVAALLHQQLSNVESSVVADVHAATGGNPMLVVLMVNAGITVCADGTAEWSTAHAHPSVVSWVLQRLGSLPATARPLLESVAVLQPDADLRIAAAAASVEAGEAGRIVDALADLELLGSGRPINFLHEFVRSSIYEDIPTERRAEIHEFAAEQLSARGNVVQAAEHLLHTESRSSSWAASTLTEAAQDAYARNDIAAASRYAQRALAETMGSPAEPELLLLLAQVAATEDDPAAVGHLLQARDEHGDVVAIANTGVQLVDQMWEASSRAALLDILAPIRGELASRDPNLALQLDLIEAVADESGSMTAKSWIDDDHPFDWSTISDGDLERLAHVVHAVAQAADPSGVTFDEVASVLRTNLTIDVIGRSRNRWSASATLRGLTAMVRMGATSEIDPLLRLAMADAEQDGRLLDAAKAGLLLAESLSAQGRLQHADDVLVAVSTMPVEPAAWRNLALVCRAVLMAFRGALDRTFALIPMLDDYDWRQLGPLQDSHAAEECGRLRLAARQWDAALHHFAHAEALANAHGIVNPALTSWRIGRAQSLAELGEHGAANRLAIENLALAREFAAPVPIARALRCLAVTSPTSKGHDLLEEALGLLEGTSNEVERCWTMLELGRIHRELDDTAAARTVLREAADIAVRVGATSLVAEATEQLRATGARPRRLQLYGSDALTPSERRVVTLAARGKTNGAIAASLYVSLKTVESHLARAYRKLGVKSRAELASLFRAEPDTDADPA